MQAMARRVAERRLHSADAECFLSSSPPPVFSFPFVMGEERTTKRMSELRASATPENFRKDGLVYVDFLASQPAAQNGGVGVIGHCFTGAAAMRIAAVRAERIAAVATFHAGGLYTGDPSSPHLLLPQIRARLYFGHAVNDKSMPREAIEKFEKALKAWGGKFESEVYAGAHHGWTVPDNPTYDKPQAGRAFKKLTGLLAAALPGSTTRTTTISS